MIRRILGVKDPRLRLVSKPIKNFDKKIISLAKDLEETLTAQKDPEGIGLAAVQIGKNVRMFAMVDNNKIKIVINPQIISTTKKTQRKKTKESVMEGCLSIINYYAPLKRPQKLTLKYQDLVGRNKSEIFQGLPAQIIQHEVDHLNGVLFTDKLLEQKISLYKLEKGEWEEVNL